MNNNILISSYEEVFSINDFNNLDDYINEKEIIEFLNNQEIVKEKNTNKL